MDLLFDPVVVWSARLLLASMFAIAAFAKVRALDEFTGVLQNYHILPQKLVRPVAVATPPLELLVALGLLFELTRRIAAAAAASLLLGFSLAMAINLVRGRTQIDCGCFVGVLRQHISWGLVTRNAALIILALLSLPDDLTARQWHWLDIITAGTGTTGAILLYLAYTHLQGMMSPWSDGGEETARW